MLRRNTSIDTPLLLTVLALIGIGCFFIYDFTVISPAVPSKNYYLKRQLVYAVLGYFSIMVVSRIDYHFLSQLTTPLLVVATMLNFCVRIVGTTGFIRWQAPYLLIGTTGIRVAQLTEIIVLLFFSQLISRSDLDRKSRILYMGLFALLACYLPMLSFSLKSTVVLMMTLCSLYFVENSRTFYIVALFSIVICVSSLLALRDIPEYETILRKELFIWLDPFSNLSGSGFPAAQSIYAIADGGLLGVGVGHGMMRYAIEDVHSFFILPAITEEIGLIGAAAILFVYLFLLMRMFLIAARAVDRCGFYLATAIIVRYVVLFITYLLVRVNLMPQIGNLSLPFISYGGTSLMTECILIGILLSVGRYQMESERR